MATKLPPTITQLPLPQKKETPEGKSEMRPEDTVHTVIAEMQRGSLAEATRKYLSCVDKCHLKNPGGRKEDQPVMPKKTKGRKLKLTLSGPMNRKRRFIKWKKQNTLLNTCLKLCKAKWYNAVIDLIGEANFQMNKDVLSHILTLLVKPRAKKKSAKKKGGRKTRRKKGTKRRKCKSKKKY